MEHQNFHAQALANQRGVSFPKSKTAVRSTKGPIGGMYFNRLPGSVNDPGTLATIQQGQLVIFTHTPMQRSGGVNYPINLGPLTLRWKCRFKEAAERNQLLGNADCHRISSGGNLTNPLNWSSGTSSTAAKLQASLLPWSTLEAPSFQNTTGASTLDFLLPVGSYSATLAMQATAAGASAPAWSPYLTSQSGYQLIDGYFDGLPASSTGNLVCYVRFNVTTAGTYHIFLYNNASQSGWTITNAQLLLVPVPTDQTLLSHKNTKIRSLAWAKVRDGSATEDKIEKAVSRALIQAGVTKEEKKECKYDEAITAAHLERIMAVCICGRFGCSLCTPSPLDTTPSTCPLCIERFGGTRAARLREAKLSREDKRPLTPEDDIEDLGEKLTCREAEQRYFPWLRAGPRIRIEEDEKSDRSKPAEKRASSLKS
jgi:hypothetical protein